MAGIRPHNHAGYTHDASQDGESYVALFPPVKRTCWKSKKGHRIIFMLEIELDLRKHCIETAIKRSYNRLISEYFRNRKGDAETEEKLALLQNALTRFDFPCLRTVHRELAGESHARIILTDKGDAPPNITIHGRPVDTEHCIKK
jgi:hypothetical protein